MDLYWRDRFICPTEEEYIVMVNNKTAGLLRLAVKLMQVCSPNTPTMYPMIITSFTDLRNFVPLANFIGILFQIRDDYQNLQSIQYTKEKGFCDDITEGKFSFPIIHSIVTGSDGIQLISIHPSKFPLTKIF